MSLNNIKKKLHGPIFSIITPFNENEQVDYVSLKKYITFLYSRGAKNFYVMMYNSRFGLLDEKEIVKLNLFCIKIVKKLNKKNIIICAEPYHCSSKKSIEYINLFYQRGADIVSLIFGEKFYSENQVYSHFKYLHDNTKCFLLLHQQLLENGISGNPPMKFYPLTLLIKICSLKRFIAMKEDAKSDNYTKKICNLLKRKIVIITSGKGKRQWIRASKYGCQSWLSGVSNLDPKISLDFYSNFKKGNKKFLRNYFKFIEEPFFKIKDKFGWHLTIKGFLEFYGHFKRYERKPLCALNINQYNFLRGKAEKIYKISEKLFNERYFKK